MDPTVPRYLSQNEKSTFSLPRSKYCPQAVTPFLQQASFNELVFYMRCSLKLILDQCLV